MHGRSTLRLLRAGVVVLARVLLVLLIGAGAAGRSVAAPGPPMSSVVTVEGSAEGGVDGRGAVRLQVGTATLVWPCASPAQARREAPRLAARFALVGATRTSLAEVASGRSDDGPALLWRGRVVLSATPAQARDLRLPTAEAVVARWVAALRAAAHDGAAPARVPEEISLGVGETRVVALPEAWKGAHVAPSPSAEVSVRLTGTQLTVRGRSAGVGEVTLRRGAAQRTVAVRVLQAAGRLPSRVSAAVSGVEADAEFVDDACERVVEQASTFAPGAGLTLLGQAGARAVGSTRRFTAWLEGPGLLPVAAAVEVPVTLCSAAFGPLAWLAASNHPERIDADGVLLDTTLGAGASAFYFHHANAPGAPPRELEVRLENRSSAPVDLLVMESGAGPSRDELYAGHLATWRYLRWMTRGNGLALRLRPSESTLLDVRRLGARDIACGLGIVAVLRGAPPSLVVEARGLGPSEVAGEGPEAVPPPAASAVRGRGLFGPPRVELQAEYVAGGPYVFVPVGAPPYGEPLGEGSPNVGNYGVEHRIRLRLVNPAAEARRIWVIFAVGGGVARGSLVVDGRRVETPLMRPASLREFALGDYLLAPGTERTVEVRAVPEPGSNYPVRIIVKPLPANQ